MVFIRDMASAHQMPHSEADQQDPINVITMYGKRTRQPSQLSVLNKEIWHVVIEHCPTACLEPLKTANTVEAVPGALSDWMLHTITAHVTYDINWNKRGPPLWECTLVNKNTYPSTSRTTTLATTGSGPKLMCKLVTHAPVCVIIICWVGIYITLL